jgi:putative two-component system response regulator
MMQAPYTPELKHSPIFVVDDEPVNLKLIERILESGGFEDVYTIQNSEDVLPRYLEMRPNLILLDINMPRLDGFGVLEKLKEETEGRLPPIVFLTAQNDSEFRVKAFENGVLDFIGKPFNRLELISRVKNLLALENAHRELANRNNSLETIVNTVAGGAETRPRRGIPRQRNRRAHPAHEQHLCPARPRARLQ